VYSFAITSVYKPRRIKPKVWWQPLSEAAAVERGLAAANFVGCT